MNILKNITILSSLIISASVHADPVAKVNLRLKAMLYESSCEVVSDSSIINVNLGTWATNDFKETGDRTGKIPFSIQLKNCNAKNMSITFNGQADSKNSELLSLNSNSTAKNIAIEILDQVEKRLVIGKASANIDVHDEKMPKLVFYANYIATADEIFAGTANATATFVLNYH